MDVSSARGARKGAVVVVSRPIRRINREEQLEQIRDTRPRVWIHPSPSVMARLRVRTAVEKRGVASGWADIAAVFGLHVKNLRAAYRKDPLLQRYIRKRSPGRYEMVVRNLSVDDWARLDEALHTRRQSSETRRINALMRYRGGRGRFVRRQGLIR